MNVKNITFFFKQNVSYWQMIHLVRVIKTNGTNNKFVDNGKSSQGFFMWHTHTHTQRWCVCYFTAFKCDLLAFFPKGEFDFLFTFFFSHFCFSLRIFGWPLIRNKFGLQRPNWNVKRKFGSRFFVCCLLKFYGRMVVLSIATLQRSCQLVHVQHHFE